MKAVLSAVSVLSAALVVFSGSKASASNWVTCEAQVTVAAINSQTGFHEGNQDHFRMVQAKVRTVKRNPDSFNLPCPSKGWTYDFALHSVDASRLESLKKGATYRVLYTYLDGETETNEIVASTKFELQ